MKKLLLVAASLHLTGCVAAAPLVMGVAGLAYSGYGLYSMGTISKGKYAVDKTEPTTAALSEIKSARSVAVFPTNSSIDGDVVDIFNERSDVKTISSKNTIAVIEKRGVDQSKILSYPSADRAVEIKQFGTASGADLVVFATVSDTGASINPLLYRARASVEVNCKIYSAKTGRILLDEEHKLSFDARDVPNDNDIAKVVAMGVSDRLYELRTGEKRETKA